LSIVEFWSAGAIYSGSGDIMAIGPVSGSVLVTRDPLFAVEPVQSICPRRLTLRIAWLAALLTMLSIRPLFAVDVSLNLLNGQTRTGELAELSPESVQLKGTPEGEKVSISELMEIRFADSASRREQVSPVAAALTDQSLIHAKEFTSDGSTLTASSPSLGKISIPIREVTDLRFAPLDETISAKWTDLRGRNARDDLLVIRKGDVLDYVAGSVGRITPESVIVLVRDKELSAPRERVFGVIFASRAGSSKGNRVGVHTLAGDVIQAESVRLKENRLELVTGPLATITLPLSDIETLDYGGGRIRFLADLPVDQSASKSPREDAPVVWFVSRNAPAGTGGHGTLTIGEKQYRRGLWLHSGAVLRYRLNREYTRLRGIAGFELTHVARMPRFDPHVRLIVTGDGQDLYQREFAWNDPPQQLDVNLTDVRELTIRVESAGGGQGILEHFALGDAQVIQ
jgi:hypothetical protein